MSVENREMMVGFTISSDPDDDSSCPSSSLVRDQCCDEEQGSPVREYQRCDALCAGDCFNKDRNTLQSHAMPCLVGKQIFGRPSGPSFLSETGLKKPGSGKTPSGRRGPRPTYLMDVAERIVTEPSRESDLKANAHLSFAPLPSLVRLNQCTSLHEYPVAVNMPVLEATHVLVKPVIGRKSAGRFFLFEAKDKVSVSGERPPGRRGSRSPNHLMVMAKGNINESLCDSDLKSTTHLSLPRLPSFASRPARLDKRTSLLGHPVAVSTKLPVVEPTRVSVKPLAGPQKRGSVAVAGSLVFFQGTFDNEDVKMKRAQPPKEAK
ncbi:hypothetical protein Q8A67_007420 [Cirrhinus molitorella]|uniref:Uncharacterized protein n=1 Tax=Cirrhinus molitorella TaxID=172907 RepID=A0AA88PWL6_9TELE|nr:hypothetical protein Q8A67_007420 [Cirrhinus molitorella]